METQLTDPTPPKQENRILIYEDDKEILLVCKLILQKNKYQVETLSKIEDVLKDVERIQPDLILMDLWIPETGGEKATSLIKTNPATSAIPVILFSANTDIREICARVNADDYLEKPFGINTLLKKIGQFFEQDNSNENPSLA